MSQKTSSHQMAVEHEAHVLGLLGAKATSGSGSKSERGDGRVRGMLRIECKATADSSRSVKLSEWTTIAAIAAMGGEVPVLALRIAGRDLVVLSLDDFEQLLEEAEAGK